MLPRPSLKSVNGKTRFVKKARGVKQSWVLTKKFQTFANESSNASLVRKFLSLNGDIKEFYYRHKQFSKDHFERYTKFKGNPISEVQRGRSEEIRKAVVSVKHDRYINNLKDLAQFMTTHNLSFDDLEGLAAELQQLQFDTVE